MLRQGSGNNRRSVVNARQSMAVNRVSAVSPQSEPTRTERAKIRAHKSRKKAPELTKREEYDPTYSLGALSAYNSGRDRDVHEGKMSAAARIRSVFARASTYGINYR